MKRDKNIYRALSVVFLILLSFEIFLSCDPVSDKKEETVFANPDSILPPVIIEAGKFDVRNLDTLLPPKVVVLSQQPAPEITPVGFYVTMKNFNTEHGLALSSIMCSYKDKAGNLWFGTSGNGASMYNGKIFTNYFSSHGLIHNFISAITEDRQGNIWFGTYGGASKYNGITFENFTTEQGLIDNNVRSILEDKKGNIWLATAGGLSRYNPAHNANGQNLFVNYKAGDGLIGGSILDIMQDRNGFLWFAGAGGISRYNPAAEEKGEKAFENFSKSFGLTDEIVYSILEDKEDNIWAGTNRLVSRYVPAKAGTPKSAFKHFTVADGLADNFVLSSIEDSEGYLWFGTKGGVSRFNKADHSFLNFTTAQGLADNQVMSITEDNSGSLWFSTYGGGLSKYEGQSVIEYSAKQGLPGKAIYAITEDKKGDLWFAPLNGGLVRYRRDEALENGGTFINYTTEQGLISNTAYSSAEDNNGNLWFGTANGLCKYDGTSFTTYTTKQGLPDDYITALYADREGMLWIGTFDGGASKFDGKSFTNFSVKQGLVHKTVWNFLEDKSGIIWIATRGGLSRYDGKRFMNFTKAQGLPDNKLSTVMEDSKGNILTGGWGGGVSIIRNKYVKQLAQPDALRSSQNIFEHFSTADGLANNVVYKILEERSGNIVIGSSYGFTIIKGGISRDGKKNARDIVENYNEKTGYPIKDVSNNYSLYEGSRGFIWAGTGDKLVRFDYSSVHKRKKPLNIFIQSIKINNEAVSWYTLDWVRKSENSSKPKNYDVPPYVADELLALGRVLTASERDTMINTFRNVRFEGIQPFYPIPEKLVLPYAQNNISFNFIGVETTRPHLVRYRYKLAGKDEKWSPITSISTASFGNIFEGNYTFMVKAESPDGVWSDPIMYSFKVLPPWYRSWYAYLFYMLVFFVGVYLVHRIQKARTIRNEREKVQQRELEQARKIEKAYRELEIEAALERVRSTSVAMRNTSDLQKVVNKVSQQMQKINININGGVFIVINAEVDRDVPIWGSGGAADYVKKAVVPVLDRPITYRLRDAIKEKKEFLVENYSREEKVEFFEHLFRHPPWNSEPPEKKRKLLSLPGGYTRSLTISAHTSIFIINNTGKIFSDKENDILKRFGRVFEQSYIRFLDLQIAEEQAKEVRRQASLDRVRGKIASMRSTEDLKQIIPVIWRELTVLGIPFIRCGVLTFDEDHSTIQIYLSASDGHLLAIFNLTYQANPFTIHVVKHWKKGAVYKEHWDREDFVNWTQSMAKQGQIRDEKAYPGVDKPPESHHLHLIPFKQGMLYIGNKKPLTNDEIDLSKSLAEAFSIAYARYDDFNQLEQAKEKVEVALVELQSAQKQLVQQEKLASLGQLTAGIAHEIKNPLNFVNNFSEVSIELVEEVRESLSDFSNQQSKNGRHDLEESVRKKPLLGRETEVGTEAEDGREQGQSADINNMLSILEDIETNLRKIHEHGHRADRIIKSMLQHSRGSGRAMELINLNTLIREFANLAFHGMRAGENPINVDIGLDLDKRVGEIPLIAEDFSRVIVNLCNNAFDAMREKAERNGQGTDNYLPSLKVRTVQRIDHVIIEIKDNGMGIPAKIKDKIMQPFFTTKKGTEGTGLGLYITNDIVKAHGGSIKIESKEGVSTTFSIILPTNHK